MIKLNLNAENKQEEVVKKYLENNASESLADKINNGVHITKDNQELINKKTLKGCMNYACEEARKIAEKGANSCCVEDVIVFGWVVHYFEEDTIEEELFTLDGEEYKPKVEISKITQSSVYKPKIEHKVEDKQTNIFDLMFENDENKENEEDKIKLNNDTEEDSVILHETYYGTETKPKNTNNVIDRLQQYFDKEVLIVR